MKILLLLCTTSFLILTGCQKEIQAPLSESNFVTTLYAGLRDSINSSTFQQLDWTRIARTKIPGYNAILVRIPFKQRDFDKQFVTAHVTASGVLQDGKILNYDLQPMSSDGFLSVASLDGVNIHSCMLQDGYSIPYLNKLEPVPAPVYQELPEVIIRGSYGPPGNGMNSSIYYSLYPVLGPGGIVGGGSSAWYWSSNPYASGAGGAATGTVVPPGGGTGAVHTGIPYTIIDEEPQLVDFEPDYNDPAINVEKFLKCFANISNTGATCKIAIYTDIPVDDDPSQIFNWESGSPGHVFIRLEKKNGTAFAKQYFGMYPKSGWKVTATTAPIDAKIVDNSAHEYNGFAELQISPAQLQLAIDHLRIIAADPKYLIDRYNCADFGLNIWNAAVSANFALNIPLFHIPGSMVAQSSTPQGLYVKLQELKNNNHPLSTGLQINVNGTSGMGTGECN